MKLLLLPFMMKSSSIPPSGILDMSFSGTSALPPSSHLPLPCFPMMNVPYCQHFSCVHWQVITDYFPYFVLKLWNYKCYTYFIYNLWWICIELNITVVINIGLYCIVCELIIYSISLFFFSNNELSTVASGSNQGGISGNVPFSFLLFPPVMAQLGLF